MIRVVKTRLRHLLLALTCLPGLLADGRQRRLLREMRALCRRLPALLQPPLPDALARLTALPALAPDAAAPDATRRLADLAALLERRSPLGLCLRRSLLRYYFLRQLQLPVVLNFGAKFVEGGARDVTGHAWLTLNGRPYHELDEDWRGFARMFTWPA